MTETDGSVSGAVITAVVLALTGGLVTLMAMAALWLRQKAKDSKTGQVLVRAWELAQSVVAHVEVHMRPQFRAAFADGKLTAEERTKLKAEALRLMKEGLGDHGMNALRGALGIFGPSVEVFLSGLIERALGVQRRAGTLPPPVSGGPLAASSQSLSTGQGRAPTSP